MSEQEHLCRNIMLLLDATVRQAPNYRVSYGEVTLNATSERRNKKRDPADRARSGYKMDVLVEFHGLHWKPEIDCGEISLVAPARRSRWT
ncbi:hypothetical protein BC936DRAFT_144647 [Jimgerdemannia flammicorona]|uniref:Uncharacterized protein n=1 Tax=Jimgerdemannia flammicorona TaxID=994334 RepID=A0A433DM20_9FUNG|nr:hypothetical protein BC936DRAFT_144647 [Jimgerdemannia flammicorona]